MKIEERNNRFYTEKGLDALNHRFESLAKLFNDGVFPINVMMLGFGNLKIDSKEELLSRIKEITELTGISWKIEREIVKDIKGTQITNEVIKW